MHSPDLISKFLTLRRLTAGATAVALLPLSALAGGHDDPWHVGHGHRGHDAHAPASWMWGHAPDQGLAIHAQASKPNYNPGETATLSAQIRLVQPSGHESALNGAARNAIELHVWFPDTLASHEITNQVSRHGNLDLQYVTPSLSANDANVWTVLIGSLSPGKAKLQGTLAKIDARATRLSELLADLARHGADPRLIARITQMRNLLTTISSRIRSLEMEDGALFVSSRALPLSVDNRLSAPSTYAQTQGGFLTTLTLDPGAATQGQTTQGIATVENVRDLFPGEALKALEDDDRDQWKVNVSWNGTLLQSFGPQALPPGELVTSTFTSDRLPPPSADLEAQVIRHRPDSSEKQYSDATLTLPVNPDSIAPTWAAESVPPTTYEYLQQPRAVSATAMDAFGFLDLATFHARLHTTVPDPNYVPTDPSDPGRTITTTTDITGSLGIQGVDQGQEAQVTGSFGNLAEGSYSLDLEIQDLAGNRAVPYPRVAPFSIDRTTPVIGFAVDPDGAFTNHASFSLPITITDASPTTTTVAVNGVAAATSAEKSFSASLALHDGVNSVEITCVDAAGNAASPVSLPVVLDNTPPVLSGLSPTNGGTVNTLSFLVSGSANEPLSLLTVNGTTIPLGGDAQSFSGFYTATATGPVSLRWVATDLAGNSSTTSTTVSIQLGAINPALLAVSAVENSNQLLVTGAPGATIPGAAVTVSASIFNSASTASSTTDGSFSVTLGFFQTATVTAVDPQNSANRGTATVSFNQNGTRISGIVLDTDGRPLPGATVMLQGTDVPAVRTDASGTFMFPAAITGHQLLVVDGSTVTDPCTDCAARQFNTVQYALNVGINQNNALQAPIYLPPYYLDGTETVVTPGSAATVTSPHAPDISLTFAADSLPAGSEAVPISMSTLPAERAATPPPEFAQPSVVLDLEPSGRTFSTPLTLDMPNPNEFPAGMNLVVFSRGDSGVWDLDGVAQVSPDGSRIITKDGQGLTHFSQVYVSPIGPDVRHFGSQDKPGASLSDGALTTSLSLPTWFTMGQEVGPKFLYSSAWAHPTVVITNMFSVPKGDDINRTFSKDVNAIGYTLGRGRVSVTGAIHVNKITALFQVGNVISDADPNTPEIEPFEFTSNIPNDVAVSCGLDLSTESSGMHPYTAHYEVHYHDTVVSTVKVFTRKFALFGPLQEDKDQRKVSRQDFDGMFPSDLQGPLVIQNRTQSAFGRGWKLSGLMQILNPHDSVVVLENGDGSTSLYGLNDKIETLFDATDYTNRHSTVNLSEGVAFDTWPRAYVGQNGAVAHMGMVDLTAGPLSSLSASYTNYNNLSGTIRANWKEYDGFFSGWHDVRRNYNFTVRHTFAGLSALPASDGRVFGVSEATHSLAMVDTQRNTLTEFIGGHGSPPTYTATASLTVQQMFSLVDSYCAQLGFSCASPQKFNGHGVSTGTVPTTGTESGSFTRLNKPRGLARNLDTNVIAIADWGNNRVLEFNLSTLQTTVVAGNMRTDSKIDDVLASQSSLVGPQALAYDSLGNLYIATTQGLIRQVDATHHIHTLAGNTDKSKVSLDAHVSADQVRIDDPKGLVVDSDHGYLYFSEASLNRVMRLDLQSSLVDLVAGGAGPNGVPTGGNGDGGPATLSSLKGPTSLGLDPDGNLLIADTGSGHNAIRRVVFSQNTGSTLTYAPTREDHSRLIKDVSGSWLLTRRDGTEIRFNSDGQESSLQDRIGHVTTFGYQGGLLTSITEPAAGRVTRFEYANGLLSAITDPVGRRTEFNLLDGQLMGIQLPDGATHSFTYTASTGLMETEHPETYRAGADKTYRFNDAHQLYQVEEPDHSVRTFTNGRATSLLSGSTGQTRTLDGTDQPNDGIQSVLSDAKGSTTSLLENSVGQLTEVTGNDGSIVDLSYDALSRPTEVELTDAHGHVLHHIRTTYNRCGDVTKNEDLVATLVTSRTYDSDLLTADQDPDCHFGQVLTETNAEGETVSHEYDAATGLPSADIDAAGRRKEYTYTAAADGVPLGLNKTVTLKGINATTQLSYDVVGNLTRVEDAEHHVTQISRDSTMFPGTGGLGVDVEVIDANGNHVAKGWDTQGRLTSVTQVADPTHPGTTTYTTRYGHLPGGLLQQIEDPHHNLMKFEYDAQGRVSMKTDAYGGQTLVTYDPNGQVGTQQDPNGNQTTFDYDGQGRLITKTMYRNDGGSLSLEDTVSLTYSDKSDLATAQDADSLFTLTHDSAQNIASATIQGRGDLAGFGPVTWTADYDRVGRRKHMTTLIGTTVQEYDAFGQYLHLTNAQMERFDFSYDTVGRNDALTRVMGAQNLTSQTTYDKTGVIKEIVHGTSGGISDLIYTRDGVGNYTSIASSRGTRAVGYDGLNEVTSATPSESSGTFPSELFTYDGIGNRITDQGGSYSYARNEQDLNRDRIAEDYRYFYTFDGNGNLTTRTERADFPNGNTTNYFYSVANQMTRMEVHAAGGALLKEAEYRYDALGHRIQKWVVDHEHPSDVTKTFTRRYVYDGDEIALEIDGAGHLLASYTHSGLRTDDVLAVNVTSEGSAQGIAALPGNYQYFKDAIGTVTEVTDSGGNIIQHMIYSAFGALLGIQDAHANDVSLNPPVATSYGFTGRELDGESGLMYYRARYYDPENGRFLQSDAAPGDINNPQTLVNGHAYAGNNATTNVDPSGQFFFLAALGALVAGIVAGATAAGLLGLTGVPAVLVGIVVGAAVGGLVSGLIYKAFGKDFNDGFRDGLLFGAIGGALGAALFREVARNVVNALIRLALDGVRALARLFGADFHFDFGFTGKAASLWTVFSVALVPAGAIIINGVQSCGPGKSFDSGTFSCQPGKGAISIGSGPAH